MPHDAAVSLTGTESTEREKTLELDSPDDAEITRLEQAATEVQVAFRGYLYIIYGVTEKQKPSRKVSSSPSPDVPQNGMDNSSEKTSDPAVTVSEDSKQPELETPPKPLAVEETFDLLNDECPAVEQQSLESGNKVVNVPMADEELDSKEDQTNDENQKTRRRRSFLAKQKYQENVSQNTPTMPSYMAATESAKAKLRAQESPSFDGVENGFIRWHSLPSSTNSKQSSMSPQMQRLVQANDKGGSKSDKSLLSSRDSHEKLAQPRWR